jgi:predicted neuraminidase
MKRGIVLAIGITLAAATAGSSGGRAEGGKPLHQAEHVFPLDTLHNHSSCIVECPNGDLLVCWYRGSGERTADDVRILGARKRRGEREWSEPFVMADTPGFPDCNPAMVIDPRRRLWLFWPVILANEWHTALLMSKRAERFDGEGPPRWSREKPVLLKPGPEFTRLVHESVERDLREVDTLPAELRERARAYLELRRKNAADKYFTRMGWMPRVHPLVLEGGRMVLPLYSDGFDFSLMAITDDGGETWHASRPLVGRGPVQPSLAQRRDGTIAAYMRDNGGPPQRVQYSESRDRGETWSPVRDLELPNSGSSVEVLALKSGLWALIWNDTERGRNSLAVSLSEDEGRTWRWTRHLERDLSPQGAGSFGYPSLIQAADGTLHATYTYSAPAREIPPDAAGRPGGSKTIRHAHFNEAWVRAGDPK